MTASRSRRLLALVAGLAVLVLAAPVPAGGSQVVPPARVVVITIPRLTWEDVRDHPLPHLEAFLAESAVGNVSLRTIGPRTSLGEAYATIGAGARAGVRDSDAGRLLERSERFENGIAAEAFARRTGTDPGDAPLLQLSFAAIENLNRSYSYDAEPGALGAALAEAGPPVALVANADREVPASGLTLDPDAPTGEPADVPSEAEAPEGQPPASLAAEPVSGQNRPAGLALMDRRGTVAAGSVSRDLLVRDPTMPFGLRMDDEEVVAAFDELAVDGSVALVELSDLERADQYRARVEAEQADALYEAALQHTDDLLGALLARTGPDDLVMVLSPAAPRAGETLTPLAVRGAGHRSGTLTSGTTGRTGYVALIDIAPTILDQFGIDPPSSMVGAPVTASNDGDGGAGRYERFIRWNESTALRDGIVSAAVRWLVVVQILLSGLGLAVLARGDRRRRRWLAGTCLVAMGVPVATFLLGLVPGRHLSLGSFLLAAVALAGALAAVALLVGRRWPPGWPRAVATATVPIALTWLVLLADVVSGGRLQINTVLGYSPAVGGRYSGFGNNAYAVLAMAAVVLAASAWTMAGADRRPDRRRVVLGGVVGLFLVTVAVDGHPRLGADVGGVLSIVPIAFVVVWLLLGRPIRIRTAALGLGATAVTLAVFTAIDLARPESEQTHLGRTVRRVAGDDGGSGFLSLLGRKVDTNVSIFLSSEWTWTLPLAVVILLVAWRGSDRVAASLPAGTGSRALLLGGAAMCLAGTLVNDSGIAVAATMLLLLVPHVLYLLAMAEPAEPAGSAESAER